MRTASNCVFHYEQMLPRWEGGREGGRVEERRNPNRKVCFSSAHSHSLLAVLSRPSSSRPDARCSICSEKPPREGVVHFLFKNKRHRSFPEDEP